MRRLAGVAGLVGALGALYWSLRLAWADYLATRNEPAALERALHWAPGNALYCWRQAQALEHARAAPEAVERALERAVAANPRAAEVWMELGLRAELRGEWARAEQCLLEAARVDRTYAPRQTLAGYYFRRGAEEAFWRWVREALERAPGDMAPLFRLCWSQTQQAGRILARALPERVEALRQYLSFLLASERWEAAAEVAERLLARGGPEDAPLLLAYGERLLQERRTPAALGLWNALVERGWWEGERLRPRASPVLSNGSFGRPPRGQGFDWRLPAVEGVALARESSASALRISFSGRQPEQCEILWQYLALEPGARYEFGFEYRSQGLAEGSGLRWQIQDLSAAPATLVESHSLAAEDWRREALRFSTPPKLRAARLVLSYRRALGTTRIRGWIALRQLSLKALSDEPRG